MLLLQPLAPAAASTASPFASTPARYRAAIAAQPWRGALEPAAECRAPVECEVTQGAIPADLRGTLFRIGAGRVRVGETPYGHWFDGDGWACALAFPGDGAPPRFRARYVDTPRRAAQAAWRGEGMAVRGAWTQRGDGSPLVNACRIATSPANTNLIYHAGRLLALCEGGPPAQLDPATLETLEPEVRDFGLPSLLGISFFGAHPKVDQRSGVLTGSGIELGLRFPPSLGLFELSPDPAARAPLAQASLPLPFFTFVHEIGLSDEHVVVVVPPYGVLGTTLEQLGAVLRSVVLGDGS